jgi:hypothetical protein
MEDPHAVTVRILHADGTGKPPSAAGVTQRERESRIAGGPATNTRMTTPLLDGVHMIAL